MTRRTASRMTMAITKAKERGAKAVVCASTGNTSASAAAYAAQLQEMLATTVPGCKLDWRIKDPQFVPPRRGR